MEAIEQQTKRETRIRIGRLGELLSRKAEAIKLQNTDEIQKQVELFDENRNEAYKLGIRNEMHGYMWSVH